MEVVDENECWIFTCQLSELTRACRAPKKVESCVIVKDTPLPLEGDGLQKINIFYKYLLLGHWPFSCNSVESYIYGIYGI